VRATSGALRGALSGTRAKALGVYRPNQLEHYFERGFEAFWAQQIWGVETRVVPALRRGIHRDQRDRPKARLGETGCIRSTERERAKRKIVSSASSRFGKKLCSVAIMTQSAVAIPVVDRHMLEVSKRAYRTRIPVVVFPYRVMLGWPSLATQENL